MRKYFKHRKSGFTLVELLVVLVIIVILMAAIIPSMLGFIDKARVSEGYIETNFIAKAAKTAYFEYYGEKGPDNASGIIGYRGTTKPDSIRPEFVDMVNRLLKDDIDTDRIDSLAFEYSQQYGLVLLIAYQYTDKAEDVIYYCEAKGKSVITNKYDEYLDFYFENAYVPQPTPAP